MDAYLKLLERKQVTTNFSLAELNINLKTICRQGLFWPGRGFLQLVTHWVPNIESQNGLLCLDLFYSCRSTNNISHVKIKCTHSTCGAFKYVFSISSRNSQSVK